MLSLPQESPTARRLKVDGGRGSRILEGHARIQADRERHKGRYLPYAGPIGQLVAAVDGLYHFRGSRLRAFQRPQLTGVPATPAAQRGGARPRHARHGPAVLAAAYGPAHVADVGVRPTARH